MPTLPELQVDFLRAVLDGPPESGVSVVLANGLDPALRIGVYANNAAANYLESLRLSFPALRRLVGDDYFDQTARAFRALHPSRSGDLQHVGAAFPAYIAGLHAADAYRYLGDVARFEWLYQESLLAADHAPLDIARLGAVAPEDYAELRFSLHPAARLFASDFPVFAIWMANLESETEPEVIDLARGADRLLMARTRGRVEIHPLTAGEAEFLGQVAGRANFARAIAKASDLDVQFDPAAALQKFVLNEAIVDF